nr:reverse transcriptase domain-containing protein [Tanacetum cinerariifolium]
MRTHKSLCTNKAYKCFHELSTSSSLSEDKWCGLGSPSSSGFPSIEATKDTVHPTNNRSTEDVQPLVVQTETPRIQISKPISEPVAYPVSAPRPNLRPSIPYPSRMQDQKLSYKANDQREKFFQIFKDLNFNISFADALILMPKFGPSTKSLLTNKDKLCELARTPLNEHCLAVLLKKLPEKLGDPGKFLIPCDFPGKAQCLALADLSASINLMPLSVWNKLSFPDLTPTCMTLELADRSISRPVGVAEDVYVKVGSFHFPTDFVVVDFDDDPRVPLILERSFFKTERALIDMFEVVDFEADPRVPLILGRSFLRIGRALIDVYEEEITLPGEVVKAKSSIEDSPELELKELPSHLEYAYLEGVDKLPVIIAKDLKVDEEEALLKVLKYHKRAISWKITDIKGIDPRFCTHKILMEEDYKPAVSIPPIVETPIVEKTNDGFQMVAKKKKKGKSKSTNNGQFGGHLVKQNVRYELKATTNVPNKGANNVGNASKSGLSHESSLLKNQPLKAVVPPTKECNITMTNSYAALDKSKEEIENVYDESVNLLNSTKTCESSSTFTVAVG